MKNGEVIEPEAFEQLPEEKLKILEMTISVLDEAGYRYIGMDHFAKPDDGLAIAQENGTLYRNFQGYSTFSNCDLIGLGVSSQFASVVDISMTRRSGGTTSV